MLSELRRMVKAEAGDEDFQMHVLNVVKYARLLAARLGVDPDLAEAAALLHDIGRHRFGGKDHDITGVPEAERILKGFGASDDMIEEVKHCVLTHGKSKERIPKTKMAEIIRNADALTHLDTLPYLLKVGLRKFDDDLKSALEWVYKKVDDADSTKLTLPEARAIAEDKLEAARLLLGANLALFNKEN